MYPETGTTKADVIHYYVEIAPFMLPHVVGRPATRKRWVDGVGTQAHPGQVFFEKNLPDSAPSWIRRTTIQHKTSRNSYIVIEDVGALAWLGQMAALEIHVPQWQSRPAQYPTQSRPAGARPRPRPGRRPAGVRRRREARTQAAS